MAMSSTRNVMREALGGGGTCAQVSTGEAQVAEMVRARGLPPTSLARSWSPRQRKDSIQDPSHTFPCFREQPCYAVWSCADGDSTCAQKAQPVHIR